MYRIKHALEGVYPSHIYTAKRNGTPIDPFLTQICYVDERHVALSFKIMNTTLRRNQMNENIFAKVRDPDTLASWEIELKYLRTEDQGPILNQMASKLAAVGSFVEMEDLFYLKATDIYEVLSVRSLHPSA